jgi:hypothetical protein
VERVEHTFLFCSYAEEVWEAIKECYGIHLQRRFFLSPRQWLFDVLERCSGIQTTAITLTFWHLWEARNDARNNEGIIHPRRIVEKIKAYVDMVVLHCFKNPRASRCESSSSPLKWTPPPAGTILMNVDAAIFASSRRMGIGAVILDHRGECLAGFSDHLPEVTTPELAEALAIRRATSFSHTQGHRFLIVASDCLSLIHRLNDPAMGRSGLGAVVADIKLMATSFQSCSFKHIPRGLNSAAHQLARSSELSSFFSFHGVVPEPAILMY